MRIKNWTKLSAEKLFTTWCAMFPCEESAIAHAIWITNRLVKNKARSSRRKFYSIKDAWLRRHQDCLSEGRVARMEERPCWDCDGTGKAEPACCWKCDGMGEMEWGEECWKCDGLGVVNSDGECSRCYGTGIHSRHILYEHRLTVAGQRYSFHSYTAPDCVSDEPGEDSESYGGCFSEEELNELGLPFSGLLKMLSYIAAACWKMKFSKREGRYFGD